MFVYMLVTEDEYEEKENKNETTEQKQNSKENH